MQDKDQERAIAWRRIRKLYRQNLAKAPLEDEERVKNEYKVAKTKQYRKQFKEDYPEWETQIDQDERLQRIARDEIKNVIRPFYPHRMKYCARTPGLNPEELQWMIETTLLTFGVGGAVASYDFYKTCITQTQPSIIINLAAVGIIVYALNRKIPPSAPKNNCEPSLGEYVDSCWPSRPNLSRPRPNYKTKLQNETTMEQRSH